MTKITGVHIFEKLGPINWEDELIAIQALSALTWKKYHGRIELYCNEEHLESLKKWGIDKLYDKIDTELLKELPTYVDRSEYWTFCKIFIPSKLEPPFVLIDTDLWITSPLEFDFTKSFVAYHEENFDQSKTHNFYNNFDDFLPEKYLNYFDSKTKPTNVALLFLNDQELISSWYNIVCEIIKEDRKTRLDIGQKATFLEQWILPMMGKKLGKDYGTFISQIYDSTNDNFMDDLLWDPPVSKWNEEEKSKFEKIKHVWGLKKFFHDDYILKEIFTKVRDYISEFKSVISKDLLEFIDKQTDYYNGKRKPNQNSLNILYLIPKIISNNETNLLINRIKSLYGDDNNIVIHVCDFSSDKKTNNKLKIKILELVGSDNFYTIGYDKNEVLNLIKQNNIELSQYDFSSYDEEFNILMEDIFECGDVRMIQSKNGIDLVCNNSLTERIEYPTSNKIIDLIPTDLDTKFDQNEIPLHIRYQTAIFLGIDFNNHHVLCLGNIDEIPNEILELINSIYDFNKNIEFHFLSDLDLDSKIINSLTKSTKIWLENIDYEELLLSTKLVIDFSGEYNSIIDESISLSIPIITKNNYIPNHSHIYRLTDDLTKNISLIKRLIFTKIKRLIPISKNDHSKNYLSFYSLVRSKQ